MLIRLLMRLLNISTLLRKEKIQKASLFISTGFLIATAKFLIEELGSSDNEYNKFIKESTNIWKNSKELLIRELLTNENVKNQLDEFNLEQFEEKLKEKYNVANQSIDSGN
uniref:Uncharacterized protein n=1 Tax=Meloidogyne hapla TaxID=6305 RepID=A0A1I8BCW4_MELHA